MLYKQDKWRNPITIELHLFNYYYFSLISLFQYQKICPTITQLNNAWRPTLASCNLSSTSVNIVKIRAHVPKKLRPLVISESYPVLPFYHDSCIYGHFVKNHIRIWLAPSTSHTTSGSYPLQSGIIHPIIYTDI